MTDPKKLDIRLGISGKKIPILPLVKKNSKTEAKPLTISFSSIDLISSAKILSRTEKNNPSALPPSPSNDNEKIRKLVLATSSKQDSSVESDNVATAKKKSKKSSPKTEKQKDRETINQPSSLTTDAGASSALPPPQSSAKPEGDQALLPPPPAMSAAENKKENKSLEPQKKIAPPAKINEPAALPPPQSPAPPEKNKKVDAPSSSPEKKEKNKNVDTPSAPPRPEKTENNKSAAPTQEWVKPENSKSDVVLSTNENVNSQETENSSSDESMKYLHNLIQEEPRLVSVLLKQWINDNE